MTEVVRSSDEQATLRLSSSQRNALKLMTDSWARAPRGVQSLTLLSLRKRGLIESRYKPGYEMMFMAPYYSEFYQWRRVRKEQAA